MEFSYLVGGLGAVTRYEQGQAVPAMMGEDGWKQVWQNVPKPTVESQAYHEMVERQARKVGLKGPKRGGDAEC